MFKDYYAILGIPISSSPEEVRVAYRTLSKKWHPDLNPGIDTKEIMQDINEAYAILKEKSTRERYDLEYKRFIQQKFCREKKTWNYDYEVADEDLKADIDSARKYAHDLVSEFFSSLKLTSKDAALCAWENIKWYLLAVVMLSVISTIVLFFLQL